MMAYEIGDYRDLARLVWLFLTLYLLWRIDNS